MKPVAGHKWNGKIIWIGMMTKSDFWVIMGLQWALFAAILFIGWLIMSTNNIETELKYMKSYNEAITSGNLQDIMCNGSPV